MSELRSAVSRSTLLDNLYAAAETLLQAVADPITIDEAPLNHRAQALDAIGRFIDRIEKREAALQAQQSKPEEKIWAPGEKLFEIVFPERTQEDVDCYVALELETPGRYPNMEDVAERIAYLEQNDPEALERFDPKLARQWLRHRSDGWFTMQIWPDGDPHPSTARQPDRTSQGWIPTPHVDPGLVRSQIAPFSPQPAHGSPFA
jgi:hypothetical protein